MALEVSPREPIPAWTKRGQVQVSLETRCTLALPGGLLGCGRTSYVSSKATPSHAYIRPTSNATLRTAQQMLGWFSLHRHANWIHSGQYTAVSLDKYPRQVRDQIQDWVVSAILSFSHTPSDNIPMSSAAMLEAIRITCSRRLRIVQQGKRCAAKGEDKPSPKSLWYHWYDGMYVYLQQL